MDIDKRIAKSINGAVNVIIARFLLAVFAVVAVVVLLSCTGVFETTVQQTLILLLAATPGALCGLLVLLSKRARSDEKSKYLVCTFMCLQAFAVAMAAYSYVGTVILLLPILLAALYPRTKAGSVVSAVMVLCGIVVPPLALVMGFWDGGYYEFLYDTSFGRQDGTATLSDEMVSLAEQVVYAVQYCSSQNLLIVGAYSVIGRLVYRQTDKSFSSQRDVVRLSEIDELTGLLNRRCFERRASDAASAESHDISCVYFDVNGLHEMNNTDGHLAGDAMLKFVGKKIQETFGEHNAFRVGGDEYVVLREGLDTESLCTAKGSLEEAFEQQGYHVAIGFAPSDGHTELGKLVQQAEKEMYQAKMAYYNKVDRRRSARIPSQDESD